MTMISGGDERVRNAFRATLRDRRPNVAATEELETNDILEVRDLAHAIARAEEVIRTPLPISQQRDMFAELALTDDCAGPAIPATNPTPLPPRMEAMQPTPQLPAPARAPILIVNHEDDAYYQPGGRIRNLADQTIEGYRPEPTFQIRLRGRRRSLGWLVALIVAPLAIFTIAALLLRPQETEAPAPKPQAPAAQAEPAPPPPAPTAAPENKPDTKAAKAENKPADTKSSAPVMHVKNLPAAPRTRAAFGKR